MTAPSLYSCEVRNSESFFRFASGTRLSRWSDLSSRSLSSFFIGLAHELGSVRGNLPARERFQVLEVMGALDGLLHLDEPAFDEVGQRLVHGHHAELGAGVDGLIDHMGLALADEVADGGGHDHDLAAGYAALAVGAGDEQLT